MGYRLRPWARQRLASCHQFPAVVPGEIEVPGDPQLRQGHVKRVELKEPVRQSGIKPRGVQIHPEKMPDGCFGPAKICGAPAPGVLQFPGHPGQVPEAVADSQPLQVQGHGPTVGEEKVGGGGIAVNQHLPVGKISGSAPPRQSRSLSRARRSSPGQPPGFPQLGHHLIQVSQAGLGRDRESRDRPGVKKAQQARQFFQAPEEGRRVPVDAGLEQEMIQVRTGYGFQEQPQGPLGPAAQEPGRQAVAVAEAQGGELQIVVIFPGQTQIRGGLRRISGKEFPHHRVVAGGEGEAQDLARCRQGFDAHLARRGPETGLGFHQAPQGPGQGIGCGQAVHGLSRAGTRPASRAQPRAPLNWGWAGTTT